MVLLYLFFALRTDAADSSRSGVESDRQSGTCHGPDALPCSRAALFFWLEAANLACDSCDRLGPCSHLFHRARSPPVGCFAPLGNLDFLDVLLIVCRFT